MAEKVTYSSRFHRWYVGDPEGEIAEGPIRAAETGKIRQVSVEEILAQYRAYVHDPEAELPQIVIDQLRVAGKI